MNILLSAFSFEPNESSEPGVAWRFAQIAAREHNVWILTADFPNRIARTRAYLASHPHGKIQVIPFWPKGIARTPNGEHVNLQYWLWQRQVIREASRLHALHNFSVVHQVTFSRYWTPTSLCLLPVPLLWGPVGSAESTPRSFLPTLPVRNRLQSMVRDLSRKISEYDPLLRRCARSARITFATTKEALTRVKKMGSRHAELMPQVFLSDDRLDHFGKLTEPDDIAPLRILSIGRNLYWKGFQYGLEAASLLKQRKIPFIYTIIGQGPFAGVLKQKAAELGIEAETVFVPRVEGDIGDALQHCHVLVHPALHETFGNVCLEALAAGRPVICLDVGGPATQVTAQCGFAAPVDSPRVAVRLMAEKLIEIATQPGRWQEMSAAAKNRARSGFALENIRYRVLRAYSDLQGGA